MGWMTLPSRIFIRNAVRQRLPHTPTRCAYLAAFPQFTASSSGRGPGSGSARGRRGGKVGSARFRRAALLCALAATLLFGPREARAQARKLRWPDATPRVSTGEKMTTGGLILGTLSWAAFVDEPLGHTRGGVLFDDALRDAWRARGRDRRSAAARASDALLYSLLLYPYVDSFAVAPARGSTDVMGQTAWLNTQSFALTWFVMAGTKRLVGRERPYLRGCRAHDGYSSRCDHAPRTYGRYSFLSGHASLAFTERGTDVCASPAPGALRGPACPGLRLRCCACDGDGDRRAASRGRSPLHDGRARGGAAGGRVRVLFAVGCPLLARPRRPPGVAAGSARRVAAGLDRGGVLSRADID